MSWINYLCVEQRAWQICARNECKLQNEQWEFFVNVNFITKCLEQNEVVLKAMILILYKFPNVNGHVKMCSWSVIEISYIC